MARHPGRAYSRYELLASLQGAAGVGEERIVDVHIKNLRKKLEPDPKVPRYVETVFGMGYRLAKL
jgi:DNA-binding response OmpR family regulator